MHCRFLTFGALVLLLAADTALLGQYPPGGYPPGGYPPGGYPPGGYPPGGRMPGGGLPFPRRGKQKKDSKQSQTQNQENLHSLTGVLRKLDDKFVILEAQDTRILNVKRSEQTKFFKDGEDLKPDTLKPGDHLIVEARQDDEGFYYAVNVIFQKQGTAAEREQASEPVHISTQASENDDDRPILRRKDSPEREPAEAAPQAAPRASAPAQPSAAAPPEAPRAAAPSTAQETAEASVPVVDPNVEVIPPPAGAPQQVFDDDDSGPPTLRRGKPTARKSPPKQVAVNRPPASAPVKATPVKETAPEPAETSAPRPVFRTQSPDENSTPPDPVIEKARVEAATFTESLPNYVCQEQIARFVNTSHIVDWRPIDIVTSEVVYENGRESYRNLAVNGKAVKKKMEELSGSWSTGEFATVLMDLFSPATAAEFRFRNESRSGGRSSLRYDFDVEREHSHWHIQVASQSVVPAYKGSIWIDKETKRTLRIEMQAYRLPSEFPLDKVESATDYEYIRIADRQFLLPVHAETLMCQQGTNVCSRNVIDFKNYHKFAGEATITFGK
jgi:hypothetical protein